MRERAEDKVRRERRGWLFSKQLAKLTNFFCSSSAHLWTQGQRGTRRDHAAPPGLAAVACPKQPRDNDHASKGNTQSHSKHKVTAETEGPTSALPLRRSLPSL